MPGMLNPDSPVPLYRQLADELRGRMRAGEFSAGSRIPSEHELAARYGLGRPTVRQATELLVRRRLLERRRGAGTFVREAPPEVDLLSLGGTLASFERSGLALSTRVLKPLRRRRVAPDPDNPLAGDSAFALERLGSVRRRPVLLERLFFAPRVFPDLDVHAEAGASLSRLVEERYGLRPSAGRQTFRVQRAEGGVARALRVEAGAPLLLVKRTLDFAGAAGAVFAELYCRTEELVFAQTLNPAMGDLDCA